MQSQFQYEKKMFWFKIKLSLFIISTWWIVAFFNLYLNYSLQFLAIQPKSLHSLIGIFTYPFVHGNLEHLLNNSLSAFMIFTSLFIIYEKISFDILGVIYLLSGILLWFIGEKGSLHVGASSIIYGVAFFLAFSGFIVRENANIAISFIIVAWYGSMIWGIFPYTTAKGISWEGHLSGALIGVLLAFWYHRTYLFNKKQKKIDKNDFHFFEKYPLE